MSARVVIEAESAKDFLTRTVSRHGGVVKFTRIHVGFHMPTRGYLHLHLKSGKIRTLGTVETGPNGKWRVDVLGPLVTRYSYQKDCWSDSLESVARDLIRGLSNTEETRGRIDMDF